MINGLININKEEGFTSHDVVAKLRGILGQKKIGHTGTLDPGAKGVLPVCLGKATKLCDMIGSWDKTYRATLLLGRETDTEDISGQVLRREEVSLSGTGIIGIISSFVGIYDQIPPMYSAKKVGGKKLYELARKGVEVERKPCRLLISDIRILEIRLPYVEFEVTCSKGTYIRSLCRDIGRKAGCGGCMASLIRTRVSDFSLEDAITLSHVETLMKEGTLDSVIRPIDSLFPFYPSVYIKGEGRTLLMNGNSLALHYVDRETGPDPASAIPEGMPERYRVYDQEGHFIGLYTGDEERGILSPDKLFFDL